MGKSSVLDKEDGNFFNQVVRDAYKDLCSNRTAYVFSSDQVKSVLTLVDDKSTKSFFTSKDVNIREDDGFFYLTNTKTRSRVKNEK